MRQAQHILQVNARRRGLFEITDEVRGWVGQQSITSGLLTLFCRHTSASLLIQENAAPAVRRDLEKFFDELAPEGAEHLKTALTQVQLSVPIMEGRLMLGTWQGVYLFEHRAHPSQRQIVLHLVGE
jgi:secondary thiamine-phosphate synthase enzyme